VDRRRFLQSATAAGVAATIDRVPAGAEGAAALDAGQSARLAAMVPSPRFYDRNRDTPWLRKKTDLILERMPGAVLP